MRKFAMLIVLWASTCHAQMGPAQVTVAPVEQRAFEVSRPLVATLEPVTRTTVAAEGDGLIAERLFDEGQRVSKGQVLARGDTALLKANRDAAVAAIEALQAMHEQAEADADKARREAGRVKELFEQNVVSEKEYRDATAAETIAAAGVKVRAAQTAEKKAELQRIDISLKKAEVVSPFEAVVSRRYVEVGQWVDRGDPIADLVQMDPLHAVVNVPEELIWRVATGDEAQVTIDAMRNGQPMTGKVDQVLPEADPASRTFAVKILLPNPEFTIKPGFFARVTLVSQDAAAQYLVPKDAIARNGTQAHVAVAREGAATLVPVQVGASAGEKVAVTGELKDDDLVIVRGNEALRGGEPLQVLNPPPGAGADDKVAR